jgi:transcriptional regulator with XRE-family HTH domain
MLAVTEEQKRAMAARLAQRMVDLGFTDERLAFKAGVSSKTVARVRRGEGTAHANTVVKLADALGVTEHELRGAPPPQLTPASEDQLDRIEEKLDVIVDALHELRVAVNLSRAVQRERSPAPRSDTSERRPGAS